MLSFVPYRKPVHCLPLRAARYPDGKLFQPEFAPEPISVYEGGIEIPITRTGGEANAASLFLRYQACDAQQCLPPARTRVMLPAQPARSTAPEAQQPGGA